MSILDQIIETKKIEIELSRKNNSFSNLEKLPGFSRPTNSLCKNLLNSDFGIIAEHKRKSPFKSVINQKCLINKVIEGYSSVGVSGISILTDQKYFGGSIDDLVISRKNTTLPILRKEFIIDEYQIIEAKAIGADAILLIASCLKKETIKNLSKCAKKLDLEVLVEIHNLNELNNCLMDSVDIIGVNNRNLKTFEVDINTSIKLSNMIPEKYLKISESGISNYDEIRKLRNYGFKGFLIGELFMKNNDPGKEVLDLIEKII